MTAARRSSAPAVIGARCRARRKIAIRPDKVGTLFARSARMARESCPTIAPEPLDRAARCLVPEIDQGLPDDQPRHDMRSARPVRGDRRGHERRDIGRAHRAAERPRLAELAPADDPRRVVELALAPGARAAPRSPSRRTPDTRRRIARRLYPSTSSPGRAELLDDRSSRARIVRHDCDRRPAPAELGQSAGASQSTPGRHATSSTTTRSPATPAATIDACDAIERDVESEHELGSDQELGRQRAPARARPG